MANEKNLIRNQERTPSERRENAKKAGVASGKARRKKKLLKDCMLDLLNLPVAKSKDFNRLAKMGLNIEDMDNRALLTAALFSKAVEFGDVAAFKEIRDLIGESGQQSDENLKKLDEVLDKIEGNI